MKRREARPTVPIHRFLSPILFFHGTMKSRLVDYIHTFAVLFTRFIKQALSSAYFLIHLFSIYHSKLPKNHFLCHFFEI